MSQKVPGMLVVSRGSDKNIDEVASVLNFGHSQIRAFNTSNLTSSAPPYDFTTTGRRLGWGLRNSVGVAEEPLTGGIYSVENSADDVKRNGVDIHQDNPGEEMNYHGFLNGSTENQGGNYGYPNCFAVWNTNIPDLGSMTTGSQFAMEQNSTVNDTFCDKNRIPPVMTFPAHNAPLDIKFQPNGSEAYVSLHGSWYLLYFTPPLTTTNSNHRNRSPPDGYRIQSIAFANGKPVAPQNSTTGAKTLIANADLTKCPQNCFRPVGLSLDSKGRLWFTSDRTGELWVMAKTGKSTSASEEAPPASATQKSFGVNRRSENKACL